MKQFNGWFGCQKCKIRGKRVSNVHVYPFVEELSMRTSNETIQYARAASHSNKVVFGVKGPTILSEIVHDFIVTTTVDVMHCVYLNVLKKLMTLWFDSEYHDHPGSLRPFINYINKHLISITPIDPTTRRPRSLDDFSYWKVAELRNFVLIYSLPILKQYMQSNYFNHHVLLVFGITVMNMTTISEEILNKAHSALTQYVKEFKILYGEVHMTANVHLLLHLSEEVRQFGPLYYNSCFSFENLKGILKRFVHGSKNPELQIHSSICMLFNLNKLKEALNKKVMLFYFVIKWRKEAEIVKN